MWSSGGWQAKKRFWLAVATLIVAILAVLVWRYRPRPEARVPPSITVMLFLNLSSDPTSEYFSDGLTEELIDGLAKVEGLRVTARSMVFQYKGKAFDVREIGGKLGVGVIVEGTVRRSGYRLRVTAQLINTVDGYHLWSQSYERQLKDIAAGFDAQGLLGIADGLPQPIGGV